MRNRTIKWVHGISTAALLLSCVLLLSAVNEVAPAAAQNNNNPLAQILTKENDILNAINALPPPSPTDLSGVTQAWDKKLTTGRFTVLSAFGGTAVRDNETGLVWEQAPTLFGTWWAARMQCSSKGTGGRLGWRLPAISELSSLVDPGVGLPPSHPFTLINPSTVFWSATALADSTTDAWYANFNSGFVDSTVKTNSSLLVWCVRGGMNAPAY